MKFNYHTMVFDLETTQDPNNRRIIEIGATILDPELNFCRGNVFTCLIHPGEVKVEQDVFDLTGITLEELTSHGVPLAGGLQAFEDWAKAVVPNLRRVRLAAWGNYFDINVLRSEYARIGRDYSWSGTAIDVKTVALLWCALSGRKTESVGVEKCMQWMELPGPDRYHRALNDAVATAAIYCKAVDQIRGGVWVDKQYISVVPG